MDRKNGFLVLKAFFTLFDSFNLLNSKIMQYKTTHFLKGDDMNISSVGKHRLGY